ncbi:CipA protein [Apiospora marii]|uniref:CipA protein n=1 Tax=Apiospora marii TaxID=335849 RepID=UPI00312F61C0
MSESKFIEKVAIVGATGTIGKYIVEALLQKGKHEVTAITRKGSTSVMPAGVTSAAVDYENPSTLVEALRGQEALIITLPSTGMDQQATQLKLVEAAAVAGVPYVLPNEWTVDMADEKLADDVFFSSERAIRRHIEELGVSSWMAVITSFWYEFSLGFSPLCYGLDWAGRTFTFYGEGTRKINTITMPQNGRAVANLLCLPIQSPGDAPSLETYQNKFVYVSSFLVSQRDMFESVLRVTGTDARDWTLRHEEATERYRAGLEEMQAGKRTGYLKLLYARVFFPDGAGNFEARRGLDNDALGLPREELDEWTRVAITNAEVGIKYGPGSGNSSS